ncbi:hypothetical protein K449DRAFT_435905 [Hypoxylon sp. EC38]|nr:hypothetical protein K449DRAFT_435905 [Hypoxylon sp. EC38]
MEPHKSDQKQGSCIRYIDMINVNGAFQLPLDTRTSQRELHDDPSSSNQNFAETPSSRAELTFPRGRSKKRSSDTTTTKSDSVPPLNDLLLGIGAWVPTSSSDMPAGKNSEGSNSTSRPISGGRFSK